MISLRSTLRTRFVRGIFSRPRVSVVVCTYDRYDVLPNAIHSLLRQRLDPGFLEIIVVDNSPDQENAARFAARFADAPGMRYLLEPTPGRSHARNVGVAHARAECVAFIDDDAVATPDWAGHIVRGFEAPPEARAPRSVITTRPLASTAPRLWVADCRNSKRTFTCLLL